MFFDFLRMFSKFAQAVRNQGSKHENKSLVKERLKSKICTLPLHETSCERAWVPEKKLLWMFA